MFNRWTDLCEERGLVADAIKHTEEESICEESAVLKRPYIEFELLNFTRAQFINLTVNSL